MKEVEDQLYGKAGGGLKLKLKERDSTVKMEEQEELSPSIDLGLGIGANHVIKHKEPTFTAAQLSELHQQALIFKYMAAGLPVPPQLVVPIWRSVTLSLGSVVAFGPQRFDYREMTEAEPGRCRRTDGKKWRCGKNVIPNRKYCEQHIHRGRQCSRKPEEPPRTSKHGITRPNDSKKPVEASENVMSRTTLLPSNSKDVEGAKSFVPDDTVDLQLAIPTAIIRTSCETAVSIAVASYATTSNIANINGSKSCTNISGKAKREENIGVRDVVMSAVRKRICPGLGFSPNSVLQVHACTAAYKSQEELEPGRCRRTDGKKWRCRRDVVPDQKYCLRHMNRGAKKPVVPVEGTSSSSVVDSLPSRCTIPKKEDGPGPGPALSTHLSIAIPSPYFHSHGEKDASSSSSSSSSSDATISDTSIISA